MTYRRMLTQGRIIVTSFWSFVLSTGSVQVIGTYMPALADEFDVGSAVLGWICSLGLAVLCLTGPVAGVVINKVESRWVVMVGGFIQAIGLMLMYVATSPLMLYIGFGVLNGIGASLVYVAGPMNIAAYFNSFYSTAIGIVFSGVGAGIFALAPLIEILITVYGWRGAALIHGALVFNVVALGALLPVRKCSTSTSTKLKQTNTKYRQINQNAHHVPKDDTIKASDERTETDFQTKWYLTYVQLLSTSPSMVLVYIVIFFLNVAYSVGIAHAYNQIIVNGYSNSHGAWALSLLGAGSLLGRFLHGIPIDMGIMLPSTLYLLSLFASALITFVNPLANNYLGFVISATGLGFLSGIMFSTLYTIMKTKVGTSLLAPAVGLELLVDGLGIMVGGYLGGAIQQLSGDYRLSFYTTGATLLFATCLFLPVCLAERKVKLCLSSTSDSKTSSKTTQKVAPV